ncbi:MAG: 3-phosphoglycerate dehydrogenase family protein [Clostridiales bacterium]|nr:3-phosphoglycerate dehydrogenase family protein [Clostridiales bacterium]
MAKIKCLNPISNVGMDLLTDNYEITDNFAQADAALVRSASVHDLELPQSLLAIARAGAGVNNIPLDKCADQGIVVFNTPGANANGVKELVLAGMFLGARDIIGGANWVQENKDDPTINKTVEKSKKKFAGTEIAGKKLGVIGLGAIGVLVANAANRLGMEVYGCDPYLSVEHALNLSRDIHVVKDNDTIYENCDYITVHVPLLDSTKGMINKETIAKMKDGVIILNFARDLLVNDDDMAEALASGKVKKYVTDFPNAKSANMPNTVAIPHLGASTEESEDNCAVMAVKELMDYVENGNITNSVNYPACDLGVVPEGVVRVCIAHRNVPNVIGRFTSILGEADVNIRDMVSKSRGAYSYAIFDLDHPIPPEYLEKLSDMSAVLKVRIIAK